MVFIVILFFVAGAISAYMYDGLSQTEDEPNNITIHYQASPTSTEKLYLDSENSVKVNLPAVNANESGVTAYLEVDARPGEGLVLVNVNNIITRSDTQDSMRSAAEIAANYVDRDLSETDLVYNLVADASMLEGPSAGAAFTVATVLALEGSDAKDDVMITGTINHDFSIGPAGRIMAKAEAAKQAGAETLLVPIGTSYEYNETEYCSDYGIFENYCKTEVVPVSIEEIAGIDVVEVRDLDDALAYMRD